ncbi:MAG: polysaccharide biosynthesis tyrosine autokinase [Synechococcales cyanobacterium RM1_1_8]|nr:polysaccharide biosynthesis tyrosine autokinase [Synechococcales cyanobacterium RM1_1_8]
MESNLEEINLKKTLDTLLRRWPIAAAVFGASVGVAAGAASLQKPAYRASGDLLFEVDRTSSILQVGNVDQIKPFADQSSPLNTQSVILQSNPILEEAIATLELSDEEGQPMPPEVIRSGLEIEPVPGTDVLRVGFNSDNPEFAASVVNAVMQSYIANNIVENRAETSAAREFILEQLPRSEQDVNQAAEALRKFRIENKIVSLEEESKRIVDLIGKLDGQITDIQSQMLDSAARATELGSKAGVTTEQAILLSNLNQSEGVQTALKEWQTANQALATASTIYTDSSPQVSALRREEQALKALLEARVLEVAGPRAGAIKPGMLQVGDLKQELAATMAQVETNRTGLQEQLRSLMAAREAFRTQASRIPTLETRQQELQRKLTATQATYENLLSRLQEIRVTENQTVGNARIIQTAKVPKEASLKKRNLMLGAGAFLGMALGIAVALFIDIFDRSLKTVGDVKELFGYTVIGLIPQYGALGNNPPGNQQPGDQAQAAQVPGSQAPGNPALGGGTVSPRIIIANSPRSLIHESYQMLRANLKFLSASNPLKSLVITSAVAGEGKSEISANLAAAMAQVGQRVLVVDGDMRDPSQHHLWGLSNHIGLSNVIVGQGSLAEAIQQVTPRLSVLTAGISPPNPLALLDSNRMAEIVEHLEERYDCVIFDTPPLAGMADAAVLGKMVDGLLLVAQPGRVNGDSAIAAKTMLERSGPNVLGIVANGVDLKQKTDGDFYYGEKTAYHDPLPRVGKRDRAFSQPGNKRR